MMTERNDLLGNPERSPFTQEDAVWVGFLFKCLLNFRKIQDSFPFFLTKYGKVSHTKAKR